MYIFRYEAGIFRQTLDLSDTKFELLIRLSQENVNPGCERFCKIASKLRF